MAEYDVTIEVTVDAADLDIAALTVLSKRVMEEEAVANGTGISILITDDESVRTLNRQFLGIDEATDVLSFPDEGDVPFPDDGEAAYLGDIAIALPTATRQAADFGHSLDAEVSHLLVHGLLHLRGYDHVESPEDEARMREREEHYLGPGAHGH